MFRLFVKTLIFIVLSTLVGFLAFSATSPAPTIVEVQGHAWLTGKDGKRTLVKGKTKLIEKAFIETALGGRVKVDLDGQRTFWVQEASEVSLPAISWESGQAPVLLIKTGALRWQQPQEKAAYNVALRSDLFEFIPPAGDFVFTIQPDKAYAEVKVFAGNIEFSALNAEDSISVKTGQQAGFQGVLEGGQIAYDILLQGKRIPRGKLTGIKPLEVNELKAEEDRLKSLKAAAELKKAQAQKAALKAKKAGYICSLPAGRMNECAWTCEGNPKGEKKVCRLESPEVRCTRQRCNANGQWAELTPLSAEIGSTACKAQVVVAPCDY